MNAIIAAVLGFFKDLFEILLGTDKNLITICVLIIVLVGYFRLSPEFSKEIAQSGLSGILGMAIGQRMVTSSSSDDLPLLTKRVK